MQVYLELEKNKKYKNKSYIFCSSVTLFLVIINLVILHLGIKTWFAKIYCTTDKLGASIMLYKKAIHFRKHDL